MDYEKTASRILECTGGRKNVMSAAHCSTRLRVAVIDKDKCDMKALEAVEGVKGVFTTSGQLQIILGMAHVGRVYSEFIDAAGISASSVEKTEKDAAAKPKIIKKALKVLENIKDTGKTAENGKKENAEAREACAEVYHVCAPVSGRVIAMKEVKDPVFASESLGKGAAVIPEEGRIVSPVDGKIAMLFPTKHAIAISADSGLAVLVHIGLNTVALNGRHFTASVSTGDIVTKGQRLLDFDMQAMRQEGYDLTVPVVIANSDEYGHVEIACGDHTDSGSIFLRVY